MKVFNYDLPVFVIKVFSKKEYRDDFIKGHMYINDASYFNKLEDKFRGDKFDSTIVEYAPILYINNQKFEPTYFTQGFIGDDKVPILCMTILNENALVRASNGGLELKQELVDELAQFGEYALFFYYGELKTNLDKAIKEKQWQIDQSVVEYVDMKKNKEYLKLYAGDIFKKYFVKDISYKEQNELRLIFLSNNKQKFTPLVSLNEHHIEFDIEQFKQYIEFNIRENIKIEP